MNVDKIASNITVAPIIKKVKILLIHIQGNKTEGSTRYGGFSRRLKKLGDFKESYILHYSALEKLVFISSKDNTDIIDIYKGHKLSDYDLIYIRGWGEYTDRVSAIAYFCKIKGIQFIDQVTAHLGTQKLSTHFKLMHANLALIDSTFARVEELRIYAQDMNTSYPLILKSSRGQKGNDNFLIKNKRSLLIRLNALIPSSEYILQPYIPNNGDYRVLCMGHEPKLVIHRKGSGGHLNNVSKGAVATLVPDNRRDPKMVDMAKKASIVSQLDICGVDIMIDKSNGNMYLLEVNSTGALVTNSFVSEKIAALKQYFDYSIGRVVENRTSKKSSKKLKTIGRHTFVSLTDLDLYNIPAKIDTGAYRSSIHADNIREVVVGENKILYFDITINGVTIQKSSENYRHSVVSSAIGQGSRFYIKSKIKLGSITVNTDLYLTHRGSLKFPVLIGRKLLNNRFIVNPAIGINKDKRSWSV